MRLDSNGGRDHNRPARAKLAGIEFTLGRNGDMLYMLDFRIGYPATMSQNELFRIWAKEAEAALAAKAEGAIVDLWKCAGTRRVLAVVDVDSHDTLDRILMDLPIMSEHGQHVDVQTIPLRRYEDFASDVRERLESGS